MADYPHSGTRLAPDNPLESLALSLHPISGCPSFFYSILLRLASNRIAPPLLSIHWYWLRARPRRVVAIQRRSHVGPPTPFPLQSAPSQRTQFCAESSFLSTNHQLCADDTNSSSLVFSPI